MLIYIFKRTCSPCCVGYSIKYSAAQEFMFTLKAASLRIKTYKAKQKAFLKCNKHNPTQSF